MYILDLVRTHPIAIDMCSDKKPFNILVGLEDVFAGGVRLNLDRIAEPKAKPQDGLTYASEHYQNEQKLPQHMHDAMS
jgi:hypothetical protein